MTSTPNRIQYVFDHIEASYPCSMQGVVSWCLEQGLGEYCCPAITSMLMARLIEIDIEDGALVINPA